jgi:SpoIID/LytB domain protein
LAGPSALPQRATDGTPTELRVGFARSGGGYDVETIPLETYIARVLAGEAARESPAAALEALAITIRTFALGNPGRHRTDGFDLCDETHCQVVRTATPATTAAAQATAGQVLMRNGDIAPVFYSASCGGRSEIPSHVWPGADDPPHLPSADDDACEGAPAWQAELPPADLLRAFQAAGFRGTALRDLRIVSRNSSGRVARLRIDGLTPSEISGQDLRVVVGRTLGWQHIKSTAFDLRWQGTGYRFTGQGFGHGVGLCVIGSTNLAARGTTATAILQKYFPGASIETAGSRVSSPASGVRISLPEGDAAEQTRIARLTAASRDEIAGALGIAAPERITLRFHATTPDFERATRQSWFTSGAWVKGDLHLLPLAVLRERGMLERTIRHALVHAMADGLLDKRPAWVRAGAAMYFAEEKPVPGSPDAARQRSEPRASCPKDNELMQPVSAGGLADAYARARSCFARQIAAGRNWRDVR